MSVFPIEVPTPFFKLMSKYVWPSLLSTVIWQSHSDFIHYMWWAYFWAEYQNQPNSFWTATSSLYHHGDKLSFLDMAIHIFFVI